MRKDEIERAAAERDKTAFNHPSTTHCGDAKTLEIKGVTAEAAFAVAFGFEFKPLGRETWSDGHVDFRAKIAGKWKTIDVKGAEYPYYLLVEAADIEVCADWIVLCHMSRGLPTFVGWDTKDMMALMPVACFAKPGQPQIPSHFRPREELRPIQQLVNLLARREE